MTEPTYFQVFCTLSELDEDLNLSGSEREARVYDKLLAASRFLWQRIGAFLPVTQTQKYNGLGSSRLFVRPLLSITTITNDGDTLAATDYILKPDAHHWPNGPYSWLDVHPDAVNLSSWVEEEEGVVIDGPWGLYSLTSVLGVTLGATMNASQTTMQVSSGASISAGLAVVIGTEQIGVVSTGSPTASVTTLGANLDAVSDTATLANGTLVSIGEIIRIGVEQMKVLDIATNTVYLQRGWNRTAKASHTSGNAVDVYRTFNVMRAVNGTTGATHDSGAALFRQCIPDDINFLTRKIAGRMLKDAQSGFIGRIGDDATGQVLYTYILPHELAALEANYYIPRTR